jgi:hypothetical protein
LTIKFPFFIFVIYFFKKKIPLRSANPSSERKFKEKIKEWKFEKNLSKEEAKFIAAKGKAREEAGKATKFYKNGVEVDQKRVERSAKRKPEAFEDLADFTARTYTRLICRWRR